jgi:hypothetical protein
VRALHGASEGRNPPLSFQVRSLKPLKYAENRGHQANPAAHRDVWARCTGVAL